MLYFIPKMTFYDYQGTADADNKENFNPDLNTYSPQKLVNQRRYKILKNIVMKNSSYAEPILKNAGPLKEKDGNIAISVEDKAKEKEKKGLQLKILEFVDEAKRKFGL